MSKKRLYILAILISALLLIAVVYMYYASRLTKLENDAIKKTPIERIAPA